MPTKTSLGSISLFKFRDNSIIRNTTQFMWLDVNMNQYVKFQLTKIESIIADSYTQINDDIGLRFISQNISSASSLYSFCSIRPLQNPYNLSGGFFYNTTASNIEYGRYGIAYIQQSAQSNKRVFMIANNSGYECGYSTYGLGRYNPTPYVYGNIVFMFK